MPYLLDLLRLAVSACLARGSRRIRAETICSSILDGYRKGLKAPGAFVLDRDYRWLRDQFEVDQPKRDEFWDDIDKDGKKAAVAGQAPHRRYRAALKDAMPDSDIALQYWPRSAGTGSLGRPRWVACGDWRGTPVIREAKAVVASAWSLVPGRGKGKVRCGEIASGRFRSPDPWYARSDKTVVRRLSPNSRKLEIKGDAAALLDPTMLRVMGHELANVHLGTAHRQKVLSERIVVDLRRRRRTFFPAVQQVMAFVTKEHGNGAELVLNAANVQRSAKTGPASRAGIVCGEPAGSLLALSEKMSGEKPMLGRTFAYAVATALCVAGFAHSAHAQAYPSRPITLIVPFPPGGSTTIMARIVGEKMGELLGQQFVVDNRGGAGGTVAARAFVRSAPDGYTLLLGYSGTITIGPSLYPNAGFDPRKDFAPIGMIGTSPAVLVTHPSFDIKSVQEVIARAKEKPGTVNYGSAGIGTVGHIAGELFVHLSGAKLTHVPYRGSGPALNDLVGGHIPLAFAPVPVVRGNVAAGTIRALAVTSGKRSALMPEVPTMVEAGLPAYEAVLRYGLLAPAGTPSAIVEKLNGALRGALATSEVQQRLATEGAEPLPSSPDEYAADIDREESRWSKIVKDAGIKAE